MNLSDEQRAAVRWQWWITAGCIGMMVLAFLVSFSLFDAAFPGGTLVPVVCFFAGLTNLGLGYLSVRYRVSIMGRRIDFWRPIEGGYAVFHGYMGIAGGVLLLGIAAYYMFSWLPAGQGVWYLLGGGFALVMLALIGVGLRRAFKED